MLFANKHDITLLSFATGDTALSAIGFPSGTRGFRMSLLFFESPSAPSSFCLSAAGAQGHIHS